MTQFTLQPIQVETASADQDGRLVLRNGRLVAVLVRLEDPIHETACGHWHLEAGFGPCAGAQTAPFVDLDEALAWLGRIASWAVTANYGLGVNGTGKKS